MNMLATAEAADHALAEEMDRYVVVKSTIYTSGERDPRLPPNGRNPREAAPDGARPAACAHAGPADAIRFLQVPVRPRDAPAAKRAPGAEEQRRARKSCSPPCPMHDCATNGFIRADHGYWAAQLVEPYVDEEIAFAIRYHQVLRFYPDESVGYKYPDRTSVSSAPISAPSPISIAPMKTARKHK